MAEVSSNADDVGRWLDDALDTFNFAMPGKNQSLGRDLAGTVAEGIQERSTRWIAPDGSKWDPNERRYAARKRAKYDANQPNVRTGQMLSLLSLVGRTTVGPDLVEMRYGIDAPPSSSLNGAELADADKDTTDVDKAGYCSTTREFYGLDDGIAGAARAVASEALSEHLGGV